MVDSVYKILEKPGPRAKSVYSNFPGSSRFLVAGVYKILAKTWFWAKPVYSNFSGLGRFLVESVYRKLKSQAPGKTCILKFSGLWQVPVLGRIQKLEKLESGQNLYTQIFRI